MECLPHCLPDVFQTKSNRHGPTFRSPQSERLSSIDSDGNNAVNGLCLNYFPDNLTDVIQVLLEAGTDANCRNNSGINALLYLCKNQKDKLIEKIHFLMDKGIDVHCKDNDKANVLHFLCRYYPNDDLYEIVKYLI